MTKYAWKIEGGASGGQIWTTKGTIEVKAGDFMLVPNEAMRQSFEQLTQGKAVFGLPGVTCKGPYRINKLTIVAMEDEQ